MSWFFPRDSEWKTLEQALQAHTRDELDMLGAALDLPKLQGRKDERIARLVEGMTGESLRQAWSQLSELQQAAVAQAVHSPDASFSPQGFKIRFGEKPDFGTEAISSHGLDRASLLCLFIHGRHVPLDLRERLLAIVPRPAVPDVPTVAEIPAKVATLVPPYTTGNRTGKAVKRHLAVYRSDGERRAVAEFAGVLRLIDAGQVAVTPKTFKVTAQSQRLIAEVLEGGDYFTAERWQTVRSEPSPRYEETSIRSFGWPQLLVEAGLVRSRGGRMHLTAAGRKALSMPPAAVLKGLWDAWRETTDTDELARISGVRGIGRCRLSDPRRRRTAIARALAQCPPGQWVEIDAFWNHLRAAGHDFQVTPTPWELTVEGLLEQIPLDIFREQDLWLMLQGRYVLCLLFEYAATLGMIDVAYTSPLHAREDVGDHTDLDYLSRYDGLRYFRLTPLGLYCLGLAETCEAEAPSVRGVLRVTGDLKVTAAVPELPRSAEVLLDLYARKVSKRVWLLERPALLEAIESGRSPARLREFLTEHSAGPLPRAVEKFLDDCEQRARCLRLEGSGQILECPDARLARRIAADKRTGKHCMLAGERRLVVPDGSVAAFRRALRQLGYGWPGSGGPGLS